MLRFVLSLTLLLALLSLVPSTASADESAARVHFKRGIDLYDKKQYPDALAEFEAAYREKPSAGIKQNIALCFKGMNRPAEAATSFDEALDEGKDTLKPETRTAIERELADLSKAVATVSITIVGADEKATGAAVITIAPVGQPPRSLAPGAHRGPIRLLPGIYTLSAKIPGHPTPDPKKLALVSGAPTEISFGADPMGTLTVHVNVPEAVIRIDGAELGTGHWTGPIPAKTLRVEVSAPGWRAVAFNLRVPPNASVDSPVTLQPVSAAPGEYVAPTTPPPKPKRIYIALTGSLEGASYRLSPAFGEPNLRHGFAGGSLGARVGFFVSKAISLEGFLEVGAMGATYKVPPSTVDSITTGTHWMLMPAIRFTTPGHIRFTVGSGVGVHGLSLEKKLSGAAAGSSTTKAAGIAAAFLLDTGAQFDVGPLFLEAAAFVNVHGVGTVKDDLSDKRALLASPGARLGLRVGLGIPF